MVDLIIALIFLGGFVSGIGRGVIRQAWALAALGVATYVAGYVYVPVADFIAGFTAGFLDSENAIRLLGFFAAFGFTSAIFSIPVEARSHGRRRERGQGQADEGRQAPLIGERFSAGILGVLESLGGVQAAAAVFLTYPILGWESWVKDSTILRTIFTELPLMISLLPSDIRGVFTMF